MSHHGNAVFESDLLQSVAIRRFGTRYDPAAGILRAKPGDQRLREGLRNWTINGFEIRTWHFSGNEIRGTHKATSWFASPFSSRQFETLHPPTALKTFARRIINKAWITACSREQARFSNALEHVEETQRHYLLNLLRRNARTQFGEKHNFSKIATVAEYQQRVPQNTYETLTPYIEAIARGEPNVLTADPVRLFQPTSGSISGTKLVPWTDRLQESSPGHQSLAGRALQTPAGAAGWNRLLVNLAANYSAANQWPVPRGF